MIKTIFWFSTEDLRMEMGKREPYKRRQEVEVAGLTYVVRGVTREGDAQVVELTRK